MTIAPISSALQVGVVDDEPPFLEHMGFWQLEAGMEQLVTSDPAEALRWVKDGRLGTLVSDLKMPGTDGLLVLERAREVGRNVRLVLLTAYVLTEAERLRAARVDADVRIKTRDLRDLLVELSRHDGARAASADRIAKMQQELEQLNEYHRLWVKDLVDELQLIPNAEERLVSSTGDRITIADLIRDIAAHGKRGRRYVELWRQAKASLRRMGRQP